MSPPLRSFSSVPLLRTHAFCISGAVISTRHEGNSPYLWQIVEKSAGGLPARHSRLTIIRGVPKLAARYSAKLEFQRSMYSCSWLTPAGQKSHRSYHNHGGCRALMSMGEIHHGLHGGQPDDPSFSWQMDAVDRWRGSCSITDHMGRYRKVCGGRSRPCGNKFTWC